MFTQSTKISNHRGIKDPTKVHQQDKSSAAAAWITCPPPWSTSTTTRSNLEVGPTTKRTCSITFQMTSICKKRSQTKSILKHPYFKIDLAQDLLLRCNRCDFDIKPATTAWISLNPFVRSLWIGQTTSVPSTSTTISSKRSATNGRISIVHCFRQMSSRKAEYQSKSSYRCWQTIIWA